MTERSVTVRQLAPDDDDWVVERHGTVYREEFSWSSEFQDLVATIVSDYRRDFQPGWENAWIAEVDGQRAGCIFCCRRSTETAQLRILLVEPWARGLGIGRQLVSRCLEFAVSAGYAKVMLWTNGGLDSAKKIYLAAGFSLVEEEPHHSFGHDLVGQIWELPLSR